MHILIYQPRISYYVGGGEVIPFEHAKFFQKTGHKVTILTCRARFINESEYFVNFKINNPEIQILYIDIPDTLKWIYDKEPGSDWERWDMESIHFAQLALPLLQDYNFDIAGVHNILDSLGIPVLKKYVLHLHGYPKTLNYLCQLLLKRNQNLIAVSNLIKNKFHELGVNQPITVSPNGIDDNQFFPIIREKKYDLIYMGRLIEIKGVQYLLEAIKILVEKFNYLDIKLAIAGKGAYGDTLKSYSQELGVSKNVTFLGYVNESEKNNLYNESKIGIFPSYDKEGILTTMLEASSCGLPIVTSENSSMSEYIENGINGLLSGLKDPESIANCIDKLLSDKAFYNELSFNNLSKIKTGWSWKVKILELDKLYEKYTTEDKLNK
jgi:glycosyltransferase involved in cell wall biosynthesis